MPAADGRINAAGGAGWHICQPASWFAHLTPRCAPTGSGILERVETRLPPEEMPGDQSEEPGPFESRLRQARKEAKLTRLEVAAKLGDGFSEASLHRWENGSAEPPFDRVRQLAELYDVSLDWLAGRTECCITHRFDHQKVVLDGDRYDRFMSLKRGDRVPEDLIAPRFLGVFQIPEKNVMVLGGDAMEAVGRRIALQAKELSTRRI